MSQRHGAALQRSSAVWLCGVVTALRACGLLHRPSPGSAGLRWRCGRAQPGARLEAWLDEAWAAACGTQQYSLECAHSSQLPTASRLLRRLSAPQRGPAWQQGTAHAMCRSLRELRAAVHGRSRPVAWYCRYQGSADAVRKNLGELRDEARGVTPARDYIVLSGSGEAPGGACAAHAAPLCTPRWPLCLATAGGPRCPAPPARAWRVPFCVRACAWGEALFSSPMVGRWFLRCTGAGFVPPACGARCPLGCPHVVAAPSWLLSCAQDTSHQAQLPFSPPCACSRLQHGHGQAGRFPPREER